MQLRDHKKWAEEVNITEGSEVNALTVSIADRWATEMEAGFAKGLDLRTGALVALEAALPEKKAKYQQGQLVTFLVYCRRVLGDCWAYGDRFASWYDGRGFEEGFSKRAFENIKEWQIEETAIS